MNEVLKLYVERERERIENKYKVLCETEYNNLPEVSRYNDIISTAETSIAELVDEYNCEYYQPFTRSAFEVSLTYELSEELEDVIYDRHLEDKNNELFELNRFAKEVSAILSISNEKDYQIEVLKNYKIIDKNGILITKE